MDDKMKEKKMRRLILTFLWCAAVILAIVFSMRLGSSDLSLKEFFSGFMKKEGYEKISFILWNLRFPRTLSGILAGIGLSVSGLALQNITGNDLAGPNIIGVNAGAGFFVIMGMYFFSPSIHVLPVFAFFGAFMATVVIVLIGGAVYEKRSAIILAGVAVTALLNAGISLISLLDTDILSAYNDFSVGGLAHSDAGELAVPAVMICVSVLVMMYYAKDIDTMMLGDEIAKSREYPFRAFCCDHGSLYSGRRSSELCGASGVRRACCSAHVQKAVWHPHKASASRHSSDRRDRCSFCGYRRPNGL